MDHKAVILAAGQGTRLKELTRETPKCLVTIAGKTILERQAAALNANGVTDITLVIGTKGSAWNQGAYEQIRDICARSGIDMVLNFDNDRTQNAYSLALALRETGECDLLAIDGDVYTADDLLRDVLRAPNKASIVTKLANDPLEPGTKVQTDGAGKVVDIGMGIKPKTTEWQIHGGIIRIDVAMFRRFQEIVSRDEYAGSGMDLPLKEYSDRHGLYSLERTGRWVNINTPEDRRMAESMIGEKK